MKSNRRIRCRAARRTGGVYVAVLGTSLVVALLGMTALLGQRIQNRMLVASADIRQAQLNANTAVELALLNIRQNANWRSAYAHGDWFANRTTTAGSCTASVTDPLDASLSDNPDESIVIRGTGRHGNAVQYSQLTVDFRRQPADVLVASAAAGGLLAGQASFAWNSAVSAYSGAGIGTAINYANLPTADQFEFARNTSFTTNTDHWESQPPGLPTASISGPREFAGHSACLRVDRSSKRAGVGNRLQVALLKPSTSYQVSIEVHPELGALQTNRFKLFMITQYANGTYVESAGSTTAFSVLNNTWTTITANITTPAWTEEPANVYLVVNSDHTNGFDHRFWVDNIHVYENVTGRLLYGQALGPTVANPNGIYWINCNGGKLLVERCRIYGTLVVLNPGADSAIANGPIHMAPATPGYPSLLVSGNFAIRHRSRALSEAELGVNYNPATPYNMPYDFNNSLATATDTGQYAVNDSYPSEIQGLVLVSGNLTFENQPRLLGQVVVGGAISGAYNLTYHPASMIAPPPVFFSYRNETRPGTRQKSVLP